MSLESVQRLILNACHAANRQPSDVRLIAVSKTKSYQDVLNIYKKGQRDFGENYVDELVAKAEELSYLQDLRWVFIGQLQSNKILRLMTVAHEIQTIASEKHARYCQRYALELNKQSFPVWIHVNAEEEAQKFGVSPAEASTLATFIKDQCPSLDLQGIMAIPPATYNDDSAKTTPTLYKDLSKLATSIGLGRLSLGMSGDLKTAIAAGSHCVRIGTAIFGARV